MGFFKEHKFIGSIILFIIIYGIFIMIRNSNVDIHNVNSLYKSDERIYKEELGEDDKKMYDMILEGALKHQVYFNIDMDEFHCYDYEDCADIVNYANEAIMVDHPELMNYGGYSWQYNNGKFRLFLKPSYYLSLKDYYGVWRIESILNKIEKETKNMTDKQKIIYVYNWMGSHNDYDYYFTFASKNQSIYSVFIKKNAVCAGFAKASQIIFQRIGIESYIVNGSSEDYHMWNIVKYNDKYYYYDSTVAVGYKKSSEHYYDGLRQETMKGYSAFHPNWYPKIEETNMFAE